MGFVGVAGFSFEREILARFRICIAVLPARDDCRHIAQAFFLPC